jgi:hypothetical protein
MDDAQNDLATARARLAEVEAEWSDLTRRIENGEASPEDFENRSASQSRVQGAREALAAAEGRALRLANATREAAFLKRRDVLMKRIGTSVPALMLDLLELKELTAEASNIGFSTMETNSLSEVFGVPAGFGDQVLRALQAASWCEETHRRVEWDFGATGPAATKTVADPPKMGSAAQYTIRDRFNEARLPHGASGITNSITGTVIVGGAP